jgi:hypothetical protein
MCALHAGCWFCISLSAPLYYYYMTATSAHCCSFYVCVLLLSASAVLMQPCCTLSPSYLASLCATAANAFSYVHTYWLGINARDIKTRAVCWFILFIAAESGARAVTVCESNVLRQTSPPPIKRTREVSQFPSQEWIFSPLIKFYANRLLLFHPLAGKISFKEIEHKDS